MKIFAKTRAVPYRYAIIADDVNTDDPLVWTNKGPARHMPIESAPTFNKYQAEAICKKNKGGIHTWVPVPVVFKYEPLVTDPYGSFSGAGWATKDEWDELYDSLEQ